jgi:adenylate cyclase
MADVEPAAKIEPRAPDRTITIRWSLIRNLCLLIVVLTGTILLTTIYTAERVRDSMSAALIERAVGQVEADVAGFLAPVERSLLLGRDLLEGGVLDIDSGDGLNRVFVPLIQAIPQISSVNIGDAEGRGYLLLRLEDRWRNRRSWTERWGHRLEFREWSGEDPETRWVVEDPPADERYDPRTRDWYTVVKSAQASGDSTPDGIYWTRPYRFFTTGELGVTAGLYVTDAGGREFVLAFDVLLRDLTEFTQHLEVSENGFGFVMDAEGRLLGLPGVAQLSDDAARSRALLRLPGELDIELLRDGGRAVAKRFSERLPTLFSFASRGETYWVQARTAALGANQSIRMVVAVPERDLVGAITQQRFFLLGAALLGFAVAVAMAFWLARRYGAPLAALARNSQRIGALDLGELSPVETTLREVHQLATEQERMRVALDSFSRYVPVEIVRELMTRGEAARIGGERRSVTALFTDVRSYTSISERLSPEALTAHMAEYFEELLGIVQGDGFGTVTQLNGDGLIALWGAPIDDAEHARHATLAVLRCRARLRELAAAWHARGLPDLPTRFGLATGPAVIGNVGARSRLVYTAMGDTMNLASRLEGLARFYGVAALAPRATRDAAGPGVLWRRVDRVRVKGKREAVEIFELLGNEADVSDAQREFSAAYEAALEAYTAQNFREAVTALVSLGEQRPDDLSVQRLVELARQLAAHAPGPTWDGVSEFAVK